jgi:hypothetical protein
MHVGSIHVNTCGFHMPKVHAYGSRKMIFAQSIYTTPTQPKTH